MKTNAMRGSFSTSLVKRETCFRVLRSGLLFGACSFFAVSGLNAQLPNWKSGLGGNGDWNEESNWGWTDDLVNYTSGPVPTSVDDAYFVNGGPSTVAVLDFEEAHVKDMYFGRWGSGKDVTINMGEGSLLNARDIFLGAASATASNLTIAGTGTGTPPVVNISGGVYTQLSSTITFADNIEVNLGGAFLGEDNTAGALTVSGQVTLMTGAVTANSGSKIVVTGEGTRFEGKGISVGSFPFWGAPPEPGQAAYDIPRHDSSMTISDGAYVQTRNNATITVGVGKYAHSNSILVEGANSILNIIDQSSQNASLEIGYIEGFGGNSVTVRDGGKITVNAGNTVISGYDANLGFNDGANRLIIGAYGTYEGTQDIYNDGLLQLVATGTLTARAIHVNNGARFEAAGSGLLTTGTGVSVNSGGTFAVGLTPEDAEIAAPEVLTMKSIYTFKTGSTLELDLFESNSNDQIDLAAGSILNIEEGVFITLSLDGIYFDDAKVGDSWTLLTGLMDGLDATSALNLANATFQLADLGYDRAWDMSQFNADGGWIVSIAIPEPSSIALAIFGGGIGLMLRKRRKL